MEHNTTMSSWGTLFHSINGHLIGQEIRFMRSLMGQKEFYLRIRARYNGQADWFRRALIWQAIRLLLLIEVASQQADVLPSTVPVSSYLPPEGSTNNVVLASPNGMFNLHIQAWRDSPSFYCMAGVLDVKINPGSMLWGANNAQPLMVSSTCRLFLSAEGDLLLQYDGNQTAWQTHTSGMGVSNLTLHDSGNLVLHTKQGLIVWQSFTQSPVFAFNSGMNLTSNITIYSSAPIANGVTSFSVPGNFSMQLHNNSNLVLFTNTNDSSRFVYWSTSLTNLSPSHTNTEQVSYVTLDDAFTFYGNSSQALGSIAPTVPPPSNYNSSLRVALVDPSSANLLAFYRTEHTWELFYNSSISVCENPMQCGNFGLCNTSTGACTCPPNFFQTSARDCEPETDLSRSCSSSALGSSVEASSYRFVSVDVSFPPQLSAISSNSVENCTSLCIDSCMCIAALFDPDTSSCSLFSNLQTLPSRPDSKQLMLLKIVADQGSKNKHLLATVLGAICAAIAVSLCLICTIAAAKRRKNRNSNSRWAPNEEGFLQALPRLPPRYTYKELEAATNEFSTKLGAGAFGAVYEGVLPSGVKIAVKKLEEGSGQSSAQFRAEVASIGSVSHVNLVILKGFCHDGDERLLVYEHMGNGSLDRWLFQRGEEGKKLGWERRCKIAMDTAKGLAYLHHECGERIVHCDVKPENILLDEEFNAKVGDFGLAKLVGQGRQSFAMTTLKGTRGYLAPEWLQDATITAKSDVYSFGVVLLELISGRRCIDSDYGYLPTLAFRIISTSSNSSHPSKVRESDWKEVVSTPAPSVEQSIKDFGTSYEKVTRTLSLPPEPIQGFAISHNRETGSKGSLSAPPESIPGSLTSHERVTGSEEYLSHPFSASHKRVTGSTEYNVGPAPPSPPNARDHMPFESSTAPSHDPRPSQHAAMFNDTSMAALLDPHLSSDANLLPTSLERMIFIGLWCVQPNSAVRPSMSVVVQMMEGVVDVRPPPMQNPLWETQESFAFTSTSSSTSQGRAVFSYERLESQR